MHTDAVACYESLCRPNSFLSKENALCDCGWLTQGLLLKVIYGFSEVKHLMRLCLCSGVSVIKKVTH